MVVVDGVRWVEWVGNAHDCVKAGRPLACPAKARAYPPF